MKRQKIAAAVLALTLAATGAALPNELFESTLGNTAVTASAEISGDYEYEVLEDGTVKISCYYGSDSTIVIPSQIDGKKVAIIGTCAFYDNTNIKSVIIPKGVNSIENLAFSHCTNLENISIPSSIKSIDYLAFADSKWIKIKQKQNPLVVVNDILIDGTTCSGSVKIPSNVTSIANSAFSDCTKITSVKIADSVKSIGESSFYGCTNLTTITIPDSVTRIGTDAFNNCTSLANVTIGNKVKSIGQQAFINCALKTVTIPENVTKIGDYAFGFQITFDPVCRLDKVSNFKISCYSGTAAETYAKNNGISYTLLDGKAKVSVKTPTISKFTSSTSAVKLTWKKVSNASGYRIYRYDSKTKKYKNVATIKTAATVSYKDSKLKSGTAYTYKIKAYAKEGSDVTWSGASDAYTAVTKPAAVKISKVKSTKMAVKLTWGKVTCTGYTIQQYSSKTKKWVTVKNVKAGTTSYKVTGLKKNTSYKFRVRAYTSAGKTTVAGAWSAVKTVKTTK